MIFGYYDHFGYRVESNGNEIYKAGNYSCESTTIVDRNSSSALSLAIIKKYCRQTANELAEERDEYFSGIERIEE